MYFLDAEETVLERGGQIKVEPRGDLVLYKLIFPQIEVGKKSWSVWKYKKDSIERAKIVSDLFVSYLIDTDQAFYYKMNRSC